MQTLESLSRSIRSAEDLYAIVRTMKTIAAVNVRHYEKVVESVNAYYGTVEKGFQAVLKGESAGLLQRAAGTVPSGLGAVVFGSDQGLAGGFNDQIVSHALTEMDRVEPNGRKRLVICVGARAEPLLEEGGQAIDQVLGVPPTLEAVTSAVQQLVLVISGWLEKGRLSRVLLFHNRPLSSAAYQPQRTILLPLDPVWLRKLAGLRWPTRSFPLHTMSKEALFSALVRQYIFVALYRAFAESMASENGARLSSMQAAQKNIEERIDDLHNRYRNQRQTAITSELLDIVSGFEALRGQTGK